jgi:pimeloyl-ACP methyl ester carboxylesterase
MLEKAALAIPLQVGPMRFMMARVNPTLCTLLVLAGCATAKGKPGTLLQDVVFTQSSPLSSNAEIIRRTLPPLTARYGQRALLAKGQALREQAIDLAAERFVVYVPGGAPPKGGYGLLVFVSPGPEALQPSYWRAPLDHHGLIFVSAANAGNEVPVLNRRLPLALLAFLNINSRYPLNPERVYIGGLSGGSRVAEMTALAYPDIFRGALLNAGSDPIGGEQGIYLPPADLFEKFQRTRLVFVTGRRDELNLDDDADARHSLRSFCVFDIEVKQPPRLGHELMDSNALEGALTALERHTATDALKLSACNAELRRGLSADFAAASAAMTRGDRSAARALMLKLDARYGGLAAAEMLALDARLEQHE